MLTYGWELLQQSEIATALTAVTLGITDWQEERLYARHHPDSARALRRLGQWLPSRAGLGRMPWALRQTPVTHGRLLGALRAARCADVGVVRALPSACVRQVADCLRDLGGLSAHRSAVLAAQAPTSQGALLVTLADRAVGWMDAPAPPDDDTPRIAAHLGACRVVLAAEMALARARLAAEPRALPDVLALVLTALERAR